MGGLALLSVMTGDFILGVLSILIGSGILLAIAAFLGKSLVAALLHRDLERFRLQLKATYDTELERFRADLRAVAFERETRFARLHEKRADVIAGLYQRLTAAEVAMTRLLLDNEGSTTPIKKRADNMAVAGNALEQYVLENKIYFDEKLCTKLDRFNEGIKRSFVTTLFIASDAFSDDEGAEQFGKTFDTLKKDIPELRHDIEREFRKLLGHSE